MKKYCFLILIVCITSCSEIIEVEDISEQEVMILAPTENSVLNITDVSFSWEPLKDAEQYKLQIATPTFNSAMQIVLDTTITTTNFIKNLNLGDYQWRVRGENTEYETEYITQVFKIE